MSTENFKIYGYRWVVLAVFMGVIAVNQVGISLRVLVRSGEFKSALENVLPPGMKVTSVPASIEDVFVGATGEGKKS